VEQVTSPLYPCCTRHSKSPHGRCCAAGFSRAGRRHSMLFGLLSVDRDAPAESFFFSPPLVAFGKLVWLLFPWGFVSEPQRAALVSSLLTMITPVGLKFRLTVLRLGINAPPLSSPLSVNGRRNLLPPSLKYECRFSLCRPDFSWSFGGNTVRFIPLVFFSYSLRSPGGDLRFFSPHDPTASHLSTGAEPASLRERVS